METNSTYGSTYKRIRQARNLSQNHATRESISRSSLSKFEHNKQTIYLDNFLSLLDEMDLNIGEFMFIDNGYQLDYAEQLKEEFYGNHFTGNPVSYKRLVERMETYLQENDDWYLERMKRYLNGVIALESDTTGQQTEAVERLVVGIWEEIDSRTEWFLNDIKFLNAIIYYLPKDSADQAIQKLLERAKNYLEADRETILLPSLHLNASLVYINQGLFEKAAHSAEAALEYVPKNHRYDMYIIALMRKGTGLKDYDAIRQAMELASRLGDEELYEFLNIEVIKNLPKYFTKYPEDLEKMDWPSDKPHEQEYKFNGYYWFAI